MAYSKIDFIEQYKQYNNNISLDRKKYLSTLRYSKKRGEYEQTPEWRQRQQLKIKIANNKCEKCNSHNKLQVHHLSYEHYGDESINELIVLCKKCHTIAHGRNKNHNRISSVAKEIAEKNRALMNLMY